MVCLLACCAIAHLVKQAALRSHGSTDITIKRHAAAASLCNATAPRQSILRFVRPALTLTQGKRLQYRRLQCFL
jgi:hypothetical protein